MRKGWVAASVGLTVLGVWLWFDTSLTRGCRFDDDFTGVC